MLVYSLHFSFGKLWNYSVNIIVFIRLGCNILNRYNILFSYHLYILYLTGFVQLYRIKIEGLFKDNF